MEPDVNPILQPLDAATIARHEKTKRELERRKLDRCKVFNFTNEQFTVVYNGYANTVPSQSDATFFRYIAEPFAIKLVDHVIIQRGEDEVAKINKQREDLGQPKIQRMQKNEIYANPDFNINNIEVRRPLMKLVWKGIVEEYGMNNIVEQQAAKQADTRPVDEQLFEEIDKNNLVAAESPEPQEPINMPQPITPDTKIEDLPRPQIETPMEDLPAA